MCATCQGDRRAGSAATIYSTRRRGEDLALADMVGGADDALGFHALDEARGAVVADLQIALHKARRGLALAGDERHGLVVQRNARAAFLLAERIEPAAARAIILGDVEEVLRLAVPLQERDDALDLFVRHKGPVHARDAPPARHVEHVAAPEEPPGAAFAQHRAAVYFPGHQKAA